MRSRPLILAALIGTFLQASQAHALMELGADFGYDRQIYGQDRQNKLANRTYSGVLAWYIFSTTALELNFTKNEQIITENNNVPIQGSTLRVKNTQNTVETGIYGVGIRQALLPQGYRLRPMISAGYARQFVESFTDYTIEDTSTGNIITFTDGPFKRRDDSVFAAFMLQWQLTRAFAIKGSIRTVFPAFNYNSARDNLKYLAGFSLFF